MTKTTTDLVGQQFADLVVIERAPTLEPGRSRWACRCICGRTKIVLQYKLRGGRVTRCGSCDSVADPSPLTPEYYSWMAMRERCNNPNRRNYRYYGGRGVTVCTRWDSFDSFLADLGPRPPGMTLDRIDTEGNYEPSNCRWADASTQNRNRRQFEKSYAHLNPQAVRAIRRSHAAGATKRALARQFGVSATTIYSVVTRKTWSHVA